MNEAEFALQIVEKQEIKCSINELPEIKILKDLDHPNIIKLNDYWLLDDPQELNMVFPICAGGDIENLVKMNQNLPEKVVLDILFQIISAIEYANIQQKIIHRDLKPSNILFNQQGDVFQIFVIDWGSACYLNGTKLCQVAGTENFCAPEVTKRNYDERSEVWSIGVLAHMLFTEIIPFNHVDTEQQANHKDLSFKQHLWAHRSNECLEITQRMLTHDPQQRITISELLESSIFKTLETPTNSIALQIIELEPQIQDHMNCVETQITHALKIAERLQISQLDQISIEFIELFKQKYDKKLNFDSSCTLGQFMQNLIEEEEQRQQTTK